MNRDTICTVENSSDLIGKIVCLPGGDRVRVLSIEDDPPVATLRRINGPLAGGMAVCRVSSLEPWDPDDLKEQTDSCS